ncbi:MAG TPA: aminopeptidase [Clostridia bacterium]|jgi:leucyl aminopeptidase (aminopeptidase T)|nr:aminopeptidase [Clostridia bacterium]
MEKLQQAARVVLEDCMGVKQGETVLIIVDTLKKEIGDVLFEQASKMQAEPLLLEMLPRENHGVEPPEAVARAMKHADVIIIPTSKSLSHTNARREANEKGARIATMPDITVEMMSRTLSGSYADIADRCCRFADMITAAEEAHITTPAGTDLHLKLTGRKGLPDTGLVHSPGEFSNLPAGEAYIAPLEGTASGRLVVDGSMAGIGRLETPIVMTVEKGFVTEITGGSDAVKLNELMDRYGHDARNIAELGIGLNERAQLSGSPLEDEKVLGTVHIGIGDNSTFGGKVSVPSHLDGIMLKPTLTLDGKTVIEGGRLL